MASALGFVLPGLALGAGAVTFQPNPRGFIPSDASGNPLPALKIVAQATVEEIHEDEYEITDHPIEVGAVISDHAYRRPARVIIRCAWSNSPSPPSGIVSQALGIVASIFGNPIALVAAAQPTIAAASSLLTGNSAPSQVKSIYQQLRALQASLIPFTILTGKRQYQNMLFQSLRVDTSEHSENSLVVTATCREVILVTTQVVPLSAATQANPSATAGPQDRGNQSLQPAPTATPDTGTVTGALTAVQGGFSQLTSMTNQSLTYLNSVNGPLSQLPGVLNTAVSSLSPVIALIPGANEIPLIANPQTLSIPLGTTSLGSDFMAQLNSLPAALTEAQAGLEGAAKQLPAVASTLPTNLTDLAPTIAMVQEQISNAIAQLSKVGVN